MSRVRHSLVELDYRYRTGEDKKTLENLVRAFRGIQKLPPTDPNSFCAIAGYHGEPFVEDPPPAAPDFWGGYCPHANVLFPTWHRIYLYRLENALRSIPGCADVTLPFWDQCLRLDEFNATHKSHPYGLPALPLPGEGSGPVEPRIIPEILTQRKFILDGEEIDNPLYSYTFQISVADVPGTGERYTKAVGYKTVRYPLSGLVGTEADRAETEIHNQKFPDDATNVQILNNNVANWLDGTVDIKPPPDTRVPDTSSVYARYVRCLEAPNYTVFSNTTSAAAWTTRAKGKLGVNNPMEDKLLVMSLESPHNAIHLAVGGFYQAGVYDASPIAGANGDMGENETAGFEPLFYFHHCFIDYVFWAWQKKHGRTAAGSLDVIEGFPGTLSTGLPKQPVNTPLDMETPLYPFAKPDGTTYSSYGVTDIVNQLGYDYGPGSFDPTLGNSPTHEPQEIVTLKRIKNINRAKISGSFVIRLYAELPSGKEFEIGREAILSRWRTERCANCQGTLEVEALVPIHDGLHRALKGHLGDDQGTIKYHAKLDTRAGRLLRLPKMPGGGEQDDEGDLPTVEDL